MTTEDRNCYKLITQLYHNSLLKEEGKFKKTNRSHYGKKKNCVCIKDLKTKLSQSFKTIKDRKRSRKYLQEDPFYPRDYEDYLKSLNFLTNLANCIIDDIVPIVATEGYQNAIKIIYILLNDTKNIIEILREKFGVLSYKRLRKLVYKLIGIIYTGIKILHALRIIHDFSNTSNAPYWNFVAFMDYLEVVCLYIITEILGTNMWVFLKRMHYKLKPYPIKRIHCVICEEFVTFDGCECTKWKLVNTKIPEQKHNLLMCISEDGPSYSKYVEVPPLWSQTINILKEIEKETNIWENPDDSSYEYSDDEDKMQSEELLDYEYEEEQIDEENILTQELSEVNDNTLNTNNNTEVNISLGDISAFPRNSNSGDVYNLLSVNERGEGVIENESKDIICDERNYLTDEELTALLYFSNSESETH